MKQLSEILAVVLADVEARISQKDKGGIRAAVFALGCRGEEVPSAEKGAGDSQAVRFSPLPAVFTTDDTDPAVRD